MCVSVGKRGDWGVGVGGGRKERKDEKKTTSKIFASEHLNISQHPSSFKRIIFILHAKSTVEIIFKKKKEKKKLL